MKPATFSTRLAKKKLNYVEFLDSLEPQSKDMKCPSQNIRALIGISFLGRICYRVLQNKRCTFDRHDKSYTGPILKIYKTNLSLTKTAFTRYRHILKTVKNVTVAKFELAFTPCRNKLKTVRNVTVKSSWQHFDAKEAYLHPKSRSVSFQKRLKLFFHHF